jgi:hypothetical protein
MTPRSRSRTKLPQTTCLRAQGQGKYSINRPQTRCAPQKCRPADATLDFSTSASFVTRFSGCTPQKCPPAGATPDFSPSVVSVIRFSGPYSIRERRRRLDGVLVVQAAQHGFRSHERTRCPWTSGFGPRSACRSCGRAWYPGSKRAVRTPAVVVSNPLAQDRAEMRLGQRDHPVQALAPDRADHPLADRVRLGARERRAQHREAQRSDRVIQAPREDAVPVMDQIPVIVSVPDHCSELLQRPGRTRMCRHVHVRQAARAVLDDDKHLQQPERCGDGYEEVARKNGRCVVLQKR